MYVIYGDMKYGVKSYTVCVEFTQFCVLVASIVHKPKFEIKGILEKNDLFIHLTL